MRTAFVNRLFELARNDKRIVLVVGDLGFGVVTRFAEELPGQFVNAGVAEQNMTGLAAGLALSGKIAFTYSIANFPVLRCLEQIRNDVCYHKASVKIVAVGGGMVYGSLGISHHATEDLAMMRALPNMIVFAPNDPTEAVWATNAAVASPGPCYLRIGHPDSPVFHPAPLELEVGRSIRVEDGYDVCLLVTGGLLHEVARAASALRRQGLSVRVLSFPCIKPLDESAILTAAEECEALFTVEEHSVVGGFGSAVAEVLAESDHYVRFKRIGIDGVFSSVVGNQEYLRAEYGLNAAGICRTVQATLNKSPLSLKRPIGL